MKVLKLCKKIGFFLKKVYGIDLMRMNVDFHIDEFGKMWFFSAKNIYLRKQVELPTNQSSMLGQFVLKEME